MRRLRPSGNYLRTSDLAVVQKLNFTLKTCQLKGVIPFFSRLKIHVWHLKFRTVLTGSLVLFLLVPLFWGAAPALADDETAPVLESSTVIGVLLDLVFDEALDENQNPALSSFTVKAAGRARKIDDISLSRDTVTLILYRPAQPDWTVEVRYTPPSTEGAAHLEDEAGNAVAGKNGGEEKKVVLPPHFPSHSHYLRENSVIPLGVYPEDTSPRPYIVFYHGFCKAGLPASRGAHGEYVPLAV